MIVIAEAGGSKTDWRILDRQKILQFQSAGFNLKTHPLEPFISNLPEELMNLSGVDTVHFYAAGVTPDADLAPLSARLLGFFKANHCQIYPDTLAAARGAFGREQGYICLLGTGSGASFYNGQGLANRIPSLGFILGDEGSGVSLGKALIVNYLRGRLPEDVQLAFEKSFGKLSEQEVLQQVYRVANPNTFISAFVSFLINHEKHPFINELIERCFDQYFEAYFPSQEFNKDQQFRFAGSIAHYFSNILMRVAKRHQVSIQRIIQSPIAGLTLYHQKHG